jgi:uncharacterized protein YutE (UPF0331/DUF86 family)/predicted nucleotidyltransferase
MDALRQFLAEDSRVDYALIFGSSARGSAHEHSDLDVAVGLRASPTRITALELGDLIARLERAAGRTVDLVILDEAPPGVAYRAFRDGRVIVEKNHRALVDRKVRAILEYLDFRPIEALAARGVLNATVHIVDNAILAKKLAAIRNAVARIREVLPASAEAFAADRTIREIVMLNLFIGLQESIGLATHWLADERWDVPQTYGDAFVALADRQVLERELATRLRAASGLRNLIAHQYGAVDSARIFELASNDLDDLLSFCQQLALKAKHA